jgi:hypothetical protein
MSAQAFGGYRARLACTDVSTASLDRARQYNPPVDYRAEQFRFPDNFRYPSTLAFIITCIAVFPLNALAMARFVFHSPLLDPLSRTPL